MKYNIGDKVRVKSLEWYNENKNELGDVKTIPKVFVSDMSRFCGQEVTISKYIVNASGNIINYNIKEDHLGYTWSDDMFEGKVEETSLRGKFGLWENKINGILFSNEHYADKIELRLGEDYEITVEDGRTFVQRKKPKYPKTYKECCGILGLTYDFPDIKMVSIDEYYLYSGFIRLIRCRDAYWKVAGEQMGLGKSWEFKNPTKHYVFTIEYSGGKIILNAAVDSMWNRILVFPTAEIRDMFYENFKELIEKCKELL